MGVAVLVVRRVPAIGFVSGHETRAYVALVAHPAFSLKIAVGRRKSGAGLVEKKDNRPVSMARVCVDA